MAFGRHVLDRVPAFDPELGAGALGSHEETLFLEQFLRAGYRLVGALDVVVEHHPDKARITAEAFANHALRLGRCAAYRQYHWCHHHVTVSRLKAFAYAIATSIQRWTGWDKTDEGGPSTSYLRRMFSLGFHSQYAKECKRPRNYEQFGLVKVAGRGSRFAKTAVVEIATG